MCARSCVLYLYACVSKPYTIQQYRTSEYSITVGACKVSLFLSKIQDNYRQKLLINWHLPLLKCLVFALVTVYHTWYITQNGRGDPALREVYSTEPLESTRSSGRGKGMGLGLVSAQSPAKIGFLVATVPVSTAAGTAGHDSSLPIHLPVLPHNATHTNTVASHIKPPINTSPKRAVIHRLDINSSRFSSVNTASQ